MHWIATIPQIPFAAGVPIVRIADLNARGEYTAYHFAHMRTALAIGIEFYDAEFGYRELTPQPESRQQVWAIMSPSGRGVGLNMTVCFPACEWRVNLDEEAGVAYAIRWIMETAFPIPIPRSDQEKERARMLSDFSGKMARITSRWQRGKTSDADRTTLAEIMLELLPSSSSCPA